MLTIECSESMTGLKSIQLTRPFAFVFVTLFVVFFSSSFSFLRRKSIGSFQSVRLKGDEFLLVLSSSLILCVGESGRT